jgi:hypothetical protein
MKHVRIIIKDFNVWYMMVLSVEIKLQVFENELFRKMYGPKDEVCKQFRIHNQEFCDLCRYPSIIRIVKSRKLHCARHVTWMGETKSTYRILVGKPLGKWLLGRLR